MILMACVDGRNGMAFNCRRQSRDRAVRADLLAEVGEACLWVSGATARQFPAEEQSRLCVDESFLEKAGPGEPCFVEDRSVAPLPGVWSGWCCTAGTGPIRRTFTGTCPWRAGLWPGGRSSPASPTRSLQRKSIIHESNPHFPDGRRCCPCACSSPAA